MQSIRSSKVLMTVIASSMILAPAAEAFEAKISGQVSRMVVAPDDAEGNEIQHQDIGWSGSRFRFTGSEEADNGLTWGFRFEIQARNNNAGTDGGQLENNGDDQDNRYQDLYLSGNFGKVSFGKGDGASNGGTEVDMSGTALASSSNLQDNWGGYKITADTDPDPDNDNGKAWKSVYTMFDGLSRQNRVRYDTPSFGGFSFAASLNQGNATELAVRYKGNFGDHQFGAAAFVDQAPEVSSSVDGADITGGSASLLLKGGLNFTVAFSESDPDSGDKSDAQFFKVGYKMGKHAVAVDLAESENGAGDEGESTGFTYAYFPHPGVELFAMVRELDSTGVAGAESVDLTSIGSRIKF
jgi:predicted porin